MTPQNNILLGSFGEDTALQFLQKLGYQIIDKNFKKKHGDIDMIAMDGETYVFVEVKTRSSNLYGAPEDAITPFKIRHLIRSAQYFCSINKLSDISMRIDVISILTDENLEVKEIKHFINITS
jgi:putative endonuclease